MTMLINPNILNVAGGLAARYWRLTFPNGPVYDPSANGRIGLTEIEMRGSIGGSDLTGSGTSTWSDAFSGSFLGSKCFDNDLSPGNYWMTSNSAGAGAWIEYDFGAPVSIAEIVVQAQNAAAVDDASGNCPDAIDFEYSNDGVSYTLALSVTGIEMWWEGVWKEFDLSTAYDEPAKFTNTGGTGDRTASITITSSGFTVNGSLSGLIDGSQADDFWWSNGSNTGAEWIKFDFGSSKIIEAFHWYQDVGTTHGVFCFEGSPDDSAWTQLGSNFTLGSGYYYFANTTGYRYYRLRTISGSHSQTPYLREIEFKIQ